MLTLCFCAGSYAATGATVGAAATKDRFCYAIIARKFIGFPSILARLMNLVHRLRDLIHPGQQYIEVTVSFLLINPRNIVDNL